MPDIAKLKEYEMSDVYQFCELIEKCGHIYYSDNHEELNKAFDKITEGISEITEIINDNYSC